MTPIVWPLAAVMLVQAMLMVATVTAPVLAPELALATKIEPHWIGVYSSLVFVGALVSILLGGSLARRFGAVTMSQIALATSGLALVATAAGNLWAISVCAVVAGFGYGLATPAASQILAKICPAWAPRHHFFFKTKYGLSRRANSRPYSTNFSGRFWMAGGNIGHRTSGNRGVHADPPIASLSG